MGEGQPRLLDQVRDRIPRNHYSIRTEQAYVDSIRRFVLRPNKSGSLDRAWPIPSRYGGRVARIRLRLIPAYARPA